MHQNDEISLFLFFIIIFITISLFLSGGIFQKKKKMKYLGKYSHKMKS